MDPILTRPIDELGSMSCRYRVAIIASQPLLLTICA
jgi:hypothetical protein